MIPPWGTGDCNDLGSAVSRSVRPVLDGLHLDGGLYFSYRSREATMTEVEIKLAIGPAEPMVRLLQDLEVDVVYPRGYEENVLLDLPWMPLRSKGAMLR